jgi:DNA-binding MarR family transcriptional regulator
MTAFMGRPPNPLSESLATMLKETIIGLVRSDRHDLSARQLAVSLIVYLDAGPHTVRGLAARMAVSKPAITRAVDRLVELSLVKRLPDPLDRRSILIGRARDGVAFMADVRRLLAKAAKDAQPEPEGGAFADATASKVRRAKT